MAEQELEILQGAVSAVVYQNYENGYAVLRRVTDDGELLTLVGCVPCAAPGENLTATGSFSSHPQYGEQFSASEVERYLPSNETEILNYLASGVVRGVGVVADDFTNEPKFEELPEDESDLPSGLVSRYAYILLISG